MYICGYMYIYSDSNQCSTIFSITESSCADKETQTDPTDFCKITNGQTVQLRRVNLDKSDDTKQGKENSEDKRSSKDKITGKDKKDERKTSKDKLDERNQMKDIKEEKPLYNNIKPLNNCDITRDKNVIVQSINEKSETL